MYVRLVLGFLVIVSTAGCTTRLQLKAPRVGDLIKDVLSKYNFEIEDHQGWQLSTPLEKTDLVSRVDAGEPVGDFQLKFIFPRCETVEGYFDVPWWKTAVSVVTLTIYSMRTTLLCSARLLVHDSKSGVDQEFAIVQTYYKYIWVPSLFDFASLADADRRVSADLLIRQFIDHQKNQSPSVVR